MNRFVFIAARVLLGLIFFVFGLNGLFHFMPTPPLPEHIDFFMKALTSTGYFLPTVAICQTLAGLLLLLNKQVPLALLILAPICVQIFLFHVYIKWTPLSRQKTN